MTGFVPICGSWCSQACECGAVSRWRREELQCDVVRVPEGKTGSVACVDDSAVFNSQFAEPVLPPLERSPICASESHVVQANLPLIEARTDLGIRKLVDTEQGLTAQQPHDVAKRTGVFIKDWLRVKEALVPRNTAVQVAHSYCDMGDCWELGQADPLIKVVGDYPDNRGAGS